MKNNERKNVDHGLPGRDHWATNVTDLPVALAAIAMMIVMVATGVIRGL